MTHEGGIFLNKSACNETYEKIKKYSYSSWALAACGVILAVSVFSSVVFPPEAGNVPICRYVSSDRHGSNSSPESSAISDGDMDEAWASVAMPQDFACYIGERAITAENLLVGGKMYIGISDIIKEFLPSAELSPGKFSVSAKADGFSLSASSYDNWIVANGRYLPCEYATGKSGALMIPLDVAARIFKSDLTVEEDNSKATLSESVGTIKSADEYYGESRLYWLSRIISAESRGESIYGKIAVGNVVLNRVASKGFPGTVYDVIFDTSSGVQFTPTSDGSIFNEPDEESVIAAKLCLEGYSVSHSILFFLNPETATNSWISENRTFVTAIGGHEFYS